MYRSCSIDKEMETKLAAHLSSGDRPKRCRPIRKYPVAERVYISCRYITCTHIAHGVYAAVLVRFASRKRRMADWGKGKKGEEGWVTGLGLVWTDNNSD